MIRIRVEVLATSPPWLEVGAKISGIARFQAGSLPVVQQTVADWIAEYAMQVRRAADELVPR